MQRNNKDRLAAVSPKSDQIHEATLATSGLMHFRAYFQSTGALSGVSEFRLGAGW